MHLDPRSEEVVVPPWLRGQVQLVLQIGLDMPIPITDLRVDDHGVFGTLSFQRSPFACRVPWESIFALVGEDGKGMVWPEALPAEIAAEVQQEISQSPQGPKRHDSNDEGNGVPRQKLEVLSPKSCSEASSGQQPTQAIRRHTGRGSATRFRAEHRSGCQLPPYLRVVK